MKNLRWGMIGTGAVTEVKSGPGLYKSENSELIGVYNINYEQGKDYARRHGVKKVYKEVREMLEDPEIDIVYVATPPKFHSEYALEILEAGKIPYVEKPIAITYDECLEIKKKSEEVNIPVYVAFYRRGIEKFLKIKKLLEEKAIGEVRYVYINQTMAVEENELKKESLPWRVIPEISGGGKFLDMGVHVLDCLIMYFGEIERMDGIVENKGGYYEADDTVAANFKFKNGVVGSGIWCYVGDRNENTVQIVGTKGRIVYDGLSAKKFLLEKNGEVKIFRFEEPEHASMPYQQAIVNEVLGKEESNANFNQSMNTVKVTEKLLKNFYRGKK